MAVQPLKGSVQVPGDKSLSHRVALFSALASGTSRVRGLLDSLDVHSTLTAIEALGARIDLAAEADGSGLSGTIDGWGFAGPRLSGDILQCGNSGTTARLLLGILSGYDIRVSLEGDESLSRRPMNRVTQPLSRMGARFLPLDRLRAGGAADLDRPAEAAGPPERGGRRADPSEPTNSPEPTSTLPLTVCGSGALKAIDHLSAVASAQVKSAVLLAGLNARGTTSITEPHKSRDHTELLLPTYGVAVSVDGLTVSVAGGQRLHAVDCEVPGDPSSAAFPLVAAALIPGSAITVRGVLLNPTRTGFLAVMRRMGADIVVNVDKERQLGGEQVGDVTLRFARKLRATVVEPHEVPALVDEVPILALLATAAEGVTVFEQVGELRVKESDRLAAIVKGLFALGCDVCEDGDDLRVASGPPCVNAKTLDAHGDHRLAMTWSIAARAFGLTPNIHGLESIGVSYPGFFDDLRRLS
jgi:3-phosphoshikimate 1-carboxyvinyltransferase